MNGAEHRRNGFRPAPQSGFSLVELLVAIATIALVVTQKVRGNMQSAECVNNLRQIAAAFRLYAQDNKNFLPQPALANKSWEQMIAPYYGGSFKCPADAELSTLVGSSYDWRDTGDPATSFAGKSLAAIGPPDAVLAFEALPGWHASRQISVVRVDGSTATLDEEECFKQLVRPVTPNRARNRIP
jgi:prepilin-type N-terminal cleavage/methylation domain-containing protein